MVCDGAGNCVNKCGRSTSKCAFVTSGAYSGSLGGLTGGDAICNNRAAAAGLNGTFKVWLSDQTGSPSTRFTQATVPYVTTTGATIANSWAALVSSGPLTPPSSDEFGAAASSNLVWTSTQFNGTPVPPPPYDYCANWITAQPAYSGIIGNANMSLGWTEAGIVPCSDYEALYCFEQ
jgi:hypothetical protein